MKSKQWYIKYPCDAFALGPIIFREKVSEREVRKKERIKLEVKKLPIGFQCWPCLK